MRHANHAKLIRHIGQQARWSESVVAGCELCNWIQAQEARQMGRRASARVGGVGSRGALRATDKPNTRE